MYPVELTGERLRLREFGRQDVDAVWRSHDAEQGILFAPPDAFSTREDVEIWMDRVMDSARARPRTQFRFAVELLGTPGAIGIARIHIDGAWDDYGSIGYAFGKEHWGHGYATEAGGLLLRFGYEQLELHRIDATVNPTNHRSIRVLEKLGMTVEGTMRGRFKTPAGERADALLYAILAPDWRARTR